MTLGHEVEGSHLAEYGAFQSPKQNQSCVIRYTAGLILCGIPQINLFFVARRSCKQCPRGKHSQRKT